MTIQEEFEAWIREKMILLYGANSFNEDTRAKNADGDYSQPLMQARWEGYQAGRESSLRNFA